jgi:hypothetical protein
MDKDNCAGRDAVARWAMGAEPGSKMACDIVLERKDSEHNTLALIVTIDGATTCLNHFTLRNLGPSIPAGVGLLLTKFDEATPFSAAQVQIISDHLWAAFLSQEGGRRKRFKLQFKRNHTRDGVFRLEIRVTKKNVDWRVFEFSKEGWSNRMQIHEQI